MLYLRGQREDYDGWAAMGCEGWSFDEVMPYFLKAEGNRRGDSDWHNGSGPLKVTDQISPHAISRAFVEAARTLQIPENDDFNGPEQEGAGLYQVTQFYGDGKAGERCSAAAAYLHPVMNRPNLTVLTRSRALRVLVENGKATGVTIRRSGRPETIRARHSVILSGGAFNSPQLLMLSGIGPADELTRQGIPVVRDLPESDRICRIISTTSRPGIRPAPMSSASDWRAPCGFSGPWVNGASTEPAPDLACRRRRRFPEIRSGGAAS